MADELISRDALFKAFEKAAWYNNADRDEIAEEILLQIPAVNAVVLPCKVGDSLYDISEFFEFYEHPEMYKLIVSCIEIRKDCHGETIFCIDGIDLKYEDFGKTVFLTREEAEKALEGREDNATD